MGTSIAEIEKNIVHRDAFHIDSSVYCPMFSTTVGLLVALDSDCTTISHRQVSILNRLLEIPAARVPEIKDQLFDQFSQYDHFYTDDKSFEYQNPDEAFAASKLSYLYLEPDDSAEADYPRLQFSVEWDPEHGAEIYLIDDRFTWNPPR